MKFYLISDNTDTMTGMRLAGVEGVVVHTAEEVSAALDRAFADEEIAVVLITKKHMEFCRERVYELKLSRRRPLILEIPDRHGGAGASDAISRYVGEAIGMKL